MAIYGYSQLTPKQIAQLVLQHYATGAFVLYEWNEAEGETEEVAVAFDEAEEVLITRMSDGLLDFIADNLPALRRHIS